MKKITLAVMAALFSFGVIASTASATPAQVKPRANSAVTEVAADTTKKAPAKKKTAKKKAPAKKQAAKKPAHKGAAA
jgi:hypothetical protein